jgi:uncharacterized protein with von Willebrand factor type A (vWA) domain
VLDLEDTVRSTAKNAGYLDLRLVPERHNAVKVLRFLDAGGSMEARVRVCEELFSAARSEFKHLEHFYFHNCVYEKLWRDNRRRRERGAHERGAGRHLAAAAVGGLFESHMAQSPLRALLWNAYESMGMVRRLMGDRMFPLALEGLERGMRVLGM